MKTDKLYLAHIIDCIRDVTAYVDGIDEKMFLQDMKTQDAALRKLQIMAESTQRLSADAKQSMSTVEWAQIAGFRNVLVHQYTGEYPINLKLVWKVIRDHLSPIREAVDKYYLKTYNEKP